MPPYKDPSFMRRCVVKVSGPARNPRYPLASAYGICRATFFKSGYYNPDGSVSAAGKKRARFFNSLDDQQDLDLKYERLLKRSVASNKSKKVSERKRNSIGVFDLYVDALRSKGVNVRYTSLSNSHDGLTEDISDSQILLVRSAHLLASLALSEGLDEFGIPLSKITFSDSFETLHELADDLSYACLRRSSGLRRQNSDLSKAAASLARAASSFENAVEAYENGEPEASVTLLLTRVAAGCGEVARLFIDHIRTKKTNDESAAYLQSIFAYFFNT
jgi:hypothetical protein